MIDTASKQGIPGHITALGHEPHHYTIFYVEVDDVQASLDKAISLGGKTVDGNLCLVFGSRWEYHRPDEARVKSPALFVAQCASDIAL